MSNSPARNRVDPLVPALLLAAWLLAPLTKAIGQDAAGSTSEDTGAFLLPSVPLRITAGVDIGYDDNVRLGGASGTGGSGSFFVRENLSLSYDRSGDRTQVKLLGVGRFAQFFDLGTDDKDGNVTLSLTHNASTRLSFNAEVYAAYRTEPDFVANVGLENVRADHFNTNDIFSITYRWLPRLATVTSYTFQRVKYAESTTETAQQDRAQHELAERLQFSLTRRTILIGEYRFQVVDYDTATRDSVTHFALAGIAHNLTEHLAVQVLGGESFRSFTDDGDTIDPYIQGKLTYESSNHSLDWTTSYGVEEPSAVAARGRTTIRTGLRLTYDLTSRISSTTGFYYHHDQNEGTISPGAGSAGSQDSFHLTFGLKYTINKHFAMHVDYEHTTVSSSGAESGYSRNRYSGGLTYTY
jgi:putative salt-induced outer membrane protein YdiY